MSHTELFLVAMIIIFTLPYLIWRLIGNDRIAPLVVVQILAGIALGPGVLGVALPEVYTTIFNESVIQSLNGMAGWAVMLFVFIAGMELDLHDSWHQRRETGITAGLALLVPLLLGALVAIFMLPFPGWQGEKARDWQFVLGIGMACAVTALPILILFMEKLGLLRQPIGQRILRYASVEDVAIWGVLAMIMMDWARVGKQVGFLLAFALGAWLLRQLMRRLKESDRWYIALIWLAVNALGADWCGLHFMVGAFLAGVVMEASWFDQKQLDQLRHHVLLVMMPVFFLSTGLRTHWGAGGGGVVLVAAALLLASVGGKLLGTAIAGRWLRWQPGEVWLIGWLLQTKALIMIIFANVLLDKAIITAASFTALLLMAVVSTMLAVPAALRAPRIAGVTVEGAHHNSVDT